MERQELLRVAIYIRVSSDEQAKFGDSIREQIDTLEDYINRHDNMIKHDTYIDDGISGQKIDRDDFSRLMEDVRMGRVNLIIFTKLDRWFRSLRHYLNTQDVLEKHNVSWTAVSQPFFDTATAHGRAFVAQSMTWAQLEAENDSERILAVFKNKVKHGEVISGTTPLGYKIVDKHLVPGEDANAVLAMFKYYSHSNSLSATRIMLQDEYGISRQQGTIRKMLKRRIYLGEYRGNFEYCPAIVSHDLFDEVQRMLSKNIKKNQKYEYLFSRLVKCEDCGRAMGAHQLSVRGRKRKDGTRITYKYNAYKCKGHYDLKECINSKRIKDSTLEQYLLSNVQEALSKYLIGYEVNKAPQINTDKKRKNIDKKIKRLKELYLNELISIEEYKADKIELENKLSEIPVVKKIEENNEYLYTILNSDLEQLYKSMTFEEKRSFWRSFISAIYIDSHKNIRIVFL